MLKCKLCGKSFPFRVEIDGKIRNLCNRKYCLDCSPWGQHNTKQLHLNNLKCLQCGKPLKGKQIKYCCSNCGIAYLNKNKLKENKQRAVDYKGGKCIECGYNKCNDALEFHHLDSKTKDKKLSRYCYVRWEKIKKELDKCILVCSNCHKEIHWEIRNHKL